MRGADYTLRWLDSSSGNQIAQLLTQIQQARQTGQNDHAIRLCQNTIQRTDQNQDHGAMGLIYAHLGEIHRLNNGSLQMTVDAFDKARLRFSLDNKQPASDRNKGIAYWSLAMVHQERPDGLDSALRDYQSASESIEKAIELARVRRLDQQSKTLQQIRQLVQEDYDALLKQVALGDPKLRGAVQALEDAGKAAQQLVREVRETKNETSLLVESLETFAANASKPVEQLVEQGQQTLARFERISRRMTWLDAASRPIMRATTRFDKLLKDYQAVLAEMQLVESRLRSLVPAADMAANTPAASSDEWADRVRELVDRLNATLAHPPAQAEPPAPQPQGERTQIHSTFSPSFVIPASLLETVQDQPDLIPVRLADQPIAAGRPITVGEISFDKDKLVRIPRNLLSHHGRLYALKVKGDSMIDAMVNDGDIIIVRYRPTADNGDMVVVWLADREETTLKYFFQQQDQIRLQPANPTMEPIYVNPAEVQIQGQVLMVIRN